MNRNMPPRFSNVNITRHLIQIGWYVKTSAETKEGNELFWSKVIGIDGNTLLIKVDNDLVRSEDHGLYYGSIFSVDRSEVIDTLYPGQPTIPLSDKN